MNGSKSITISMFLKAFPSLVDKGSHYVFEVTSKGYFKKVKNNFFLKSFILRAFKLNLKILTQLRLKIRVVENAIHSTFFDFYSNILGPKMIL